MVLRHFGGVGALEKVPVLLAALSDRGLTAAPHVAQALYRDLGGDIAGSCA